MDRRRWILIGLSGLLVAGEITVVIFQRQGERELRRHLAMERERNRELNRLRDEHRRLVAAQANEGELATLREDRAALDRLRSEIDALKRRAKEGARPNEAREARPAAFIPASEWRNAGQSTPAAVVQTVLWAAAGGDVETLTRMLFFDAKVKAEADLLFAGLPEAVRQQYGSAERVIALLTAKDVPLGAMQPLEEKPFGPDDVAIAVRLQSPEGKNTTVALTAHRAADGWQLKVPRSALQKYAKAFQNATTAASVK